MSQDKKHEDALPGDWSGLISNVRISPTADPELFTELARSAHRERSRRLRALALLGLYAARWCDPNSVSTFAGLGGSAGEKNEPAKGDVAMRGATQKMLGSLSGK